MSGESIGGAAGGVRRIADAVPSGEAADLGDLLERIRDQLGELIGTEHELTEHAGQLTTSAESVFRDLIALREALSATADHHLGSSGPAPAPSGRSAPVSASARPTVRAADGSEYPAEAGADVVNLPPRVQARSNQRTVGQVTLNGRPVGEIRSGNDAWSASVSRRLEALGLVLQRAMHAHTEMKLAAMMVDTGATEGTVTINNVPCGSQAQQVPGCHQTLERFLRSGSTLTVRGTTEQGEPFAHTYRGRATL